MHQPKAVLSVWERLPPNGAIKLWFVARFVKKNVPRTKYNGLMPWLKVGDSIVEQLFKRAWICSCPEWYPQLGVWLPDLECYQRIDETFPMTAKADGRLGSVLHTRKQREELLLTFGPNIPGLDPTSPPPSFRDYCGTDEIDQCYLDLISNVAEFEYDAERQLWWPKKYSGMIDRRPHLTTALATIQTQLDELLSVSQAWTTEQMGRNAVSESYTMLSQNYELCYATGASMYAEPTEDSMHSLNAFLDSHWTIAEQEAHLNNRVLYVDIGMGTGTALTALARHRAQDMLGIEYDAVRVQIALKNMIRNKPQTYDVKMAYVAKNILDVEDLGGLREYYDCVLLYLGDEGFNEAIMTHIGALLDNLPVPIVLLSSKQCRHKHYAGFWETYGFTELGSVNYFKRGGENESGKFFVFRRSSRVLREESFRARIDPDILRALKQCALGAAPGQRREYYQELLGKIHSGIYHLELYGATSRKRPKLRHDVSEGAQEAVTAESSSELAETPNPSNVEDAKTRGPVHAADDSNHEQHETNTPSDVEMAESVQEAARAESKAFSGAEVCGAQTQHQTTTAKGSSSKSVPALTTADLFALSPQCLIEENQQHAGCETSPSYQPGSAPPVTGRDLSRGTANQVLVASPQSEPTVPASHHPVFSENDPAKEEKNAILHSVENPPGEPWESASQGDTSRVDQDIKDVLRVFRKNPSRNFDQGKDIGNTYGELTFGSTSQVVKRLTEILLQANENPSKQIIAELGSGYGGYVAGLVTGLDCKAFGIENMPDYYNASIASLADAVSKGMVAPGKLAYVHADLYNFESFGEATIATVFDEAFEEKLVLHIIQCAARSKFLKYLVVARPSKNRSLFPIFHKYGFRLSKDPIQGLSKAFSRGRNTYYVFEREVGLSVRCRFPPLMMGMSESDFMERILTPLWNQVKSQISSNRTEDSSVSSGGLGTRSRTTGWTGPKPAHAEVVSDKLGILCTRDEFVATSFRMNGFVRLAVKCGERINREDFEMMSFQDLDPTQMKKFVLVGPLGEIRPLSAALDGAPALAAPLKQLFDQVAKIFYCEVENDNQNNTPGRLEYWGPYDESHGSTRADYLFHRLSWLGLLTTTPGANINPIFMKRP